MSVDDIIRAANTDPSGTPMLVWDYEVAPACFKDPGDPPDAVSLWLVPPAISLPASTAAVMPGGAKAPVTRTLPSGFTVIVA